jgi:membrane associated rhomboid family serine protease
MDDEKDSNGNNITPFPGQKERRERQVLRVMRVANDGRSSPSEPAINLPPAVKALGFLMISIHLLQWAAPFFIGEVRTDRLIEALGFVAARYTDGKAWGIPAFTSPITHMFIHGSWLHLGVNVLSLLAFGAGLEKWVGARRMLLLFFLTAIIGAFLQCLLQPHLTVPMVGASGGISGMFGALLVEMNARGNLRTNGRNPLLVFAAVWILTALFFGFMGVPGAGGAISWATHIGGFLAGMGLARTLSKRPF